MRCQLEFARCSSSGFVCLVDRDRRGFARRSPATFLAPHRIELIDLPDSQTFPVPPFRFPLPVRPGRWCSNAAFDVCGVPIPPAVVARRLSWRVVPCGHLLLGLLVRVTSSPASLPKSHHSIKLVPDRSSTTERGQGAVAWPDGAGRPSHANPCSEGGIGQIRPASSQSGSRGRSPWGEPGWSLTQPRGDRARRPAHSRPTAAQPTSASVEGSGTTNSDGSR